MSKIKYKYTVQVFTDYKNDRMLSIRCIGNLYKHSFDIIITDEEKCDILKQIIDINDMFKVSHAFLYQNEEDYMMFYNSIQDNYYYSFLYHDTISFIRQKYLSIN